MAVNWNPLFSKIVDSSLWLEDDTVVKVFLTMFAKSDKDHVCRGTAFNIAQWAKKTEQEVIDAIKVLCSPDTKRIEKQPHDGCRLLRIDDGWLILNGKHYHDIAVRQLRRDYKAAKQMEYRQPGYQKKRRKPVIVVAPEIGNGESSLGSPV